MDVELSGIELRISRIAALFVTAVPHIKCNAPDDNHAVLRLKQCLRLSLSAVGGATASGAVHISASAVTVY